MSTPKERPILFSGEMIKAILAGRKTQTRRVIKPQPKLVKPHSLDSWLWKSPIPWEKGMRLWVRETFQEIPNNGGEWVYRATDPDWETTEEWKWRPSIFMPREASRITLEIVSVHVERVGSIADHDCIAEGIDFEKHKCGCEVCSRTSRICPATASSLFMEFAELWDSINGKRDGGKFAWAKSPWVWCIAFRRLP